MSDKTYVFITEDRMFGELISLGAHVSLVKYSVGGVEYEEYLENDEFIICEDNDD